MKKGLLGSTALVGATALMAGAAGAAEAPTWKLTGNANFQFYWVDQDYASTTKYDVSTTDDLGLGTGTTHVSANSLVLFRGGNVDPQDHDWYFGVDEAELQLNVSGTADNGLNYGFKIEINALTTDGPKGIADEVRLQLSGGWGTLQMGDEDGAEDIMNYGGENLMGATGGFDGDQDDYLVRGGDVDSMYVTISDGNVIYSSDLHVEPYNIAAPSYPTIAGDTSDATKISYFSPRFSGFQVGASLTPTPNNGDNFKEDGRWENNIAVGANYDNSFGDLRIRASAVYVTASNAEITDKLNNGPTDGWEDISAWQVGGIIGWGPFSIGANYGDNGDSGRVRTYDHLNNATVTAPVESSFWDVAASFETGPMYFAIGYFVGTAEIAVPGADDSTYEHIALTADYTVAPGLSAYAEINLISDELLGGNFHGIDVSPDSLTNDTTSFVAGMNISF